MGRALYRKYRSKSLSEIVGQSHITEVLTRSLAQNRIAHAYLLTGPRGVGKTSIARILAYEINKLPYDETATNLDIIEIDAASNNGVEDVRELREKVQVAPVSATKKIYIIDEVHMLSKAAFNALLKTLEEPPEHAVFILATTDVDKLPATIISRTQRFSLRAIGQEDAVKHLKHIAKEEKIVIDDEALSLVAQRGDGSFRDSISLLDQLASLADKKEGITARLVEEALGLAPAEHVEKLLAAYEAKDLKSIVALLDESDASGVQPTILVHQLIQTVRGQIAEKPQLIELLDKLLDIHKSPQPQIKLLTVLAAHAQPKPKTAALIAPPLEVKAPIKELEEQATKHNPTAQSTVNTSAPSPKDIQQRVTTRGVAPTESSASARASVGADVSAGPASTKAIDTSHFDWEKLVEYTRQHFVAIYSVLSKCKHELSDSTLTLYTGNAFYKKKLDDSKYRVNLAKSLAEVGVPRLTIETIPTPPPPKDGVAASVAAIMGGGEEVSVGE